MGSSVLNEKISEPHTIEIDGRLIKCESLADALALKIAEVTATAGRLISNESLTAPQLVRVARKYGYDGIADAIEELR
jgi:hypothetical protein